MMNKSILSYKIKELRKYNKINQKEFAKSINVTQSALSMYENGTNLPSVDVISKIVATYNVSYNWIFGMEEETVSFLTPIDMIKFILSLEKSNELNIRAYIEKKTPIYGPSKHVEKIKFELIPQKFTKEVVSFFSEYEELKEKASNLNDPDFQAQVIDMWLERKFKELSDAVETTDLTSEDDNAGTQT